ncbi:MAG: NUDIX domain-containing protein [archaeon]|nr:MAG: NUDIX domain-containing protein [archaeon]
MAEKKYPEPIAGTLVFNPGGKVFLLKSHKWKGQYMMPGGHIELGEKIEDALKREIKEETNMDIHDIEFICFQEFIFGDEFWKKKHFIFLDFACKTNSTDVELNDEAQEYVWVSLDEVFKLPIEPYTKKAIEKYIEKAKK